MTPGDRKYTRTHEWIKIDGDTAVIGITDHAQKAMGDVTYIDGPAVGLAVEPGGELGVIESVNAGLEDAPELVNEDPYDRGWIVKLKSVDPAAFDTLMDADAYEAFLTA
jgi:glycine cleavage system H protein